MAILKTADGARLHYRLQGRNKTGRALIMNHGWCSNVAHWEPQAQHFSRNHPVLRVDRRGMGKSKLGKGNDPARGRTASEHAQDIAAVAQKVGIRGAVVLGHAGGGPATLALANQYPELVSAVVMVDSAMYPQADLNDSTNVFGSVLSGMLDSLEGKVAEGPTGKDALEVMYRSYFASKCDASLVQQCVDDALQTPLPTVIAELRGMAVDTQSMGAALVQPVLWLTAAGVDQSYISASVADVQFAQVVGAGHFPQLEVPQQVNAMLDTFVSQLDTVVS